MDPSGIPQPAWARGGSNDQTPVFVLIVTKGYRRGPVAFSEVFTYNFQKVKTMIVIQL